MRAASCGSRPTADPKLRSVAPGLIHPSRSGPTISVKPDRQRAAGPARRFISRLGCANLPIPTPRALLRVQAGSSVDAACPRTVQTESSAARGRSLVVGGRGVLPTSGAGRLRVAGELATASAGVRVRPVSPPSAARPAVCRPRGAAVSHRRRRLCRAQGRCSRVATSAATRLASAPSRRTIASAGCGWASSCASPAHRLNASASPRARAAARSGPVRGWMAG